MKHLSVVATLALAALCAPSLVFGLSVDLEAPSGLKQLSPTESPNISIQSSSLSPEESSKAPRTSTNDEQVVGMGSGAVSTYHTSSRINQRPQVQPVVSPKDNDYRNDRPQLRPQVSPAIQPAPSQLSPDVMPLDEDLIELEDENEVVFKSKRQSSNRDQARFFIPGNNWGGWQGGNGNNNNVQKPGSCYRPSNNNNNNYGNTNYPGTGLGGYYMNSRTKRQAGGYSNGIQAQPYYTNTNTNGYSSGFGSSGGNNYPGSGNNGNGFNYPGTGTGGQHGGNSGWNGGSGGSNYYCYRDSDCAGNKKCCSSQCRTPAFFG